MLQEEVGRPVMQISAATGWGLEVLQKRIFQALAKLEQEEESVRD